MYKRQLLTGWSQGWLPSEVVDLAIAQSERDTARYRAASFFVLLVLAACVATSEQRDVAWIGIAALGATIEVPTLERPVKVKVPAGSQCGRVLRLKGRGVERGTTTGDLLVELRVTVPTTLNDDARAAVEALQSATAGDDPRRELARKAAW